MSKAEDLMLDPKKAEEYLNGALTKSCEYGHQQCANRTHGPCSGELADLLHDASEEERGS